MFKKIIAAFAALLAATAFAAVDVNKASQAELEAVKGIGPVISTLIISERKKGDFKDWNDLVTRVKGVGDKSAGKFSGGGLTVNGATFTGAPMAAATTEKAPVTAKVGPGTSRAASATKETASKAASAVEGGAKKAEKAEMKAGKAAAAASAPMKK